MLQNLDITPKSRNVMLMKIRQKGESEVEESTILGGELYAPKHWQDNSTPIRIGHGIYVRKPKNTSSTSPKHNQIYEPGNTSSIQRIYRCWHTYYVQAATSTYEVIPFK